MQQGCILGETTCARCSRCHCGSCLCSACRQEAQQRDDAIRRIEYDEESKKDWELVAQNRTREDSEYVW